MVEYFDPLTGSKKKREFGYDAQGKERARKFFDKQKVESGRSGYGKPKMKSGIKPKSGKYTSPGPGDARHHPGVKIKDKRFPKVEGKEKVYVQPKEKEVDKKITVGYGGPDYNAMWT
tara:strand:+ start:1735 stop:2085 length:351 start_codon:yes stop_codon:yes gene_type:complete